MNAPVERKVATSTVAAFVIGIVIAVLNGVQENPGLLAVLPPFWQGLVLVLVPTLVTFIAGYYARHTPRNSNNDPNRPLG